MSSPPAPSAYPPLRSTLLLISTKSYFSPARTLTYLKDLLNPDNGVVTQQNSRFSYDVLLALIPDFLTIHPCAEVLKSSALQMPNAAHPPGSWPISLGAQDCFWESTYGPYTGEVVPQALKELGVSIVEIGHAERRKLLSETDTTTAKKAAAVCRCKMIPLVCIGETDPPPSSDGPMSMAVGNAMRQLTPQITSVLTAIPSDAPVIFAYEPVWAIGAQRPAGVDFVGPVVQSIWQVISRTPDRTGVTKVVYGGSAGPGLWSGKTNGGNGLGKWVDGMFLGRFAHEIGGVREVVEEVLASIEAKERNR
jgi:triosephosphate isomerase (TIM)